MNLLIIGNGFDLHCRLHSRYSDYFDWVNKRKSIVKNCGKHKSKITLDKQLLNNYKENFSGLVNNHNVNTYHQYEYSTINLHNTLADIYRYLYHNQNAEYNKRLYNMNVSDLWTSYFIMLKVIFGNKNKNLQWNDVEQNISIFLNMYLPHVKYCLHKFVDGINGRGDTSLPGESTSEQLLLKVQNPYNYWSYVELYNIYDKFFDNLSRRNFILVVWISLLILSYYKSSFITQNKSNYGYELKDIYNSLFNQLSKLESHFSSFISSLFTKDSDNYISRTDYLNNVSDTIKNMIQSSDDLNDYNILSFNYTDIGRYSHIIHVHSMVDDSHYKHGHPIFGIDSNEIHIIDGKKIANYQRLYYMFTKTYRIMALSNNREYRNNVLPPRKFTNNIVFYGHSLAAADYSYFESIFDYYKIYDSSVNLIFYYSNDFINYKNNPIRQERERNQVRQNAFTNIYKLINKYGSVVHHGNNLLHKLLLEGRLHIRKMPSLPKN